MLEPRALLSGSPIAELANPHPEAGGQFGSSVTVLTNGNVVIVAANDDAGGGNSTQALTATTGGAGAVYLYNGQTGALISTLTGSRAGDLYNAQVTALTNGNFVLDADNWNGSVGAVTWGNGTSGVSGTISNANSLVGTTTGDQIGLTGVVALNNGNYVVGSYAWHNDLLTNAGEVTWGDGTKGIDGAVSSSNSLIGSYTGDYVGFGGITPLASGNYVVDSFYWTNFSSINYGAVTFGDGAHGSIHGAVSTTNSLYGTHSNDRVGQGGVTALTNGNYVVASHVWDNGSITDAGAATWANGTVGITGAITSSNSLVGSTSGDHVGIGGVTALTNGNFVVNSYYWNNGAVTSVGAVTWGNGLGGAHLLSGTISSTNSLIGPATQSYVGVSGVTALTNGNYVISSNAWDNGATANVGAVTWGDGTNGTHGTVTTSNSVVGSTANDNVGLGGVTALTNGNYVIDSYAWSNGGTLANGKGAVTFEKGTALASATVGSGNSLVGSTTGDQIGNQGITALTGGNYVVSSTYWHNGSVNNAGAATWGSGTTGIVGSVTSLNSVVGTAAYDDVGQVYALSNGNYVVDSYYWNNGGDSSKAFGSVNWGNGSSGTVGTVTAVNRLYGTVAGTSVGSGGVVALASGNYVVSSPKASSGLGEIDFLNGSAAITINSSIVGNAVSTPTSVTSTADNKNNRFFISFANDGAGHVYRGDAVNGYLSIPSNIALSSSTIEENIAVGATVGTLTTTDANPGVTYTYRLGNTADDQAFAISGANLTTNKAFNAGTQSSYTVDVTVTDSDYVSYTKTFTITVQPVPTAITLDHTTVKQGLPSGTPVGNFSTTENLSGHTYTYTLASGGTDNGSFTISGNSLMTNAVFSAATKRSYSILVQVQDNLGQTFQQYFTIIVLAPPTAIALTNSSIAEQIPLGSTVGFLTTTDLTSGASFTYSLGNTADDQAFAISGSYLVTKKTLNHATQSSYSLDLTVTDSYGQVYTQVVPITVQSISNWPAQFVDPHPVLGNQFGSSVTILKNGNVVIVAQNDDAGGGNASQQFSSSSGGAGAVYLYNGQTGALISTLTGSHSADLYGATVTALANGNFVVDAPHWSYGNGAVTWGSGTLGINGTISASNSLTSSFTGNSIGIGGVTALTNGNYVVDSYDWLNSIGAVTWGDGTVGVHGTISTQNSLTGSTGGSYVGLGGVTALTNGKYVVDSYDWGYSNIAWVGAVTLADGTNGLSGSVSATNSLVGATSNSQIGSGGIVTLTNGNFVVVSPLSAGVGQFNFTSAGAITWENASTGVVGSIDATNSFSGVYPGDSVGSGGVIALSNGNFVVDSPSATFNSSKEGAVTWGSGVTGLKGNISSLNSLTGATANDSIGSAGVTALTNGNYVIDSPNWDAGSLVDAGAVTWGNGVTGSTGVIGTNNSLVGSSTNDYVGLGGITALTNGNFVVNTPDWDAGSVVDAGAVTWGNGTTGTTGAIGATNSLVGSSFEDYVGYGGITALTNGNFVVDSYFWNNGGSTNNAQGAVTWESGSNASTGSVSASNSLVGSTARDQVGLRGVVSLTNGNYVVSSPSWTNGSVVDAGAVTWGSGTTGVKGAVSSSNSLVGSSTYDLVGDGGSTALTDGNYVADSYLWANGLGAVTWGNGTTGAIGLINQTNSLVGSKVTDEFGLDGVVPFSNGAYLVRSSFWNGGVEAATFAAGGPGISGVVSSANSTTGQAQSLTRSVTATVDKTNNRFFASIPNGGSGHVYRGDTVSGFLTPPSDIGLSKSTIAETAPVGTTVATFVPTDPNHGVTYTYTLGSSADDQAFAISGGNLVTKKPLNFTIQSTYNIDVTVTDSDGLSYTKSLIITVTPSPTSISLTGTQVTEGSPSGFTVGTLSTTEPLDGHTFSYSLVSGNSDNLSFSISGNTLITATTLNAATQSSYSILIQVQDENGNTFQQSFTITVLGRPTGIVITNSMIAEGIPVGSTVGVFGTIEHNSNGIFTYSLGNTPDDQAFVISGNSLVTNKNLTYASQSSYTIYVTVADSYGHTLTQPVTITLRPATTWPAQFVDPHPVLGNRFGSSITVLSNGNVVVVAANDDAGGGNSALKNGAGAVYLFNGQTGALISTLTGTHPGDLYNATVTALTNGNAVLDAPNWSGNMGAVTWIDGTHGLSGTISSGNSLVGTQTNDFVGIQGITALPTGDYVVSSPNWSSSTTPYVGAVTWENGTQSTSGTIDSANSLTGSAAADSVGSGGVTLLSNGNYVVVSPGWNKGATGSVGAVTWEDGTTSLSGTVTSANSLIGSTMLDDVGSGGVSALSNGNYVITSSFWNNGSISQAGAVTWVDGTHSISGTIGVGNSLVGASAYDEVGSGGITTLSNGNYVIDSYNWHSGSVVGAGAVTWGNGLTGIHGTISSSNSLVGSSTSDEVGNGQVTALTNGNYVVSSTYWNNGDIPYAGAVTWGDGIHGTSGVVGSGNSLVGSISFGYAGYGGITALTNGNYVISSPYWSSSSASDVGAITWADGSQSSSGTVGIANSLVGSTNFDEIGQFGATALSNGNYVIASPSWDNGSVAQAGAVTWADGTQRTTGTVSASNSLVGAAENDQVGFGGVTALGDGNYLVVSSLFSGKLGAATFEHGDRSASGTVNMLNSVTGQSVSSSPVILTPLDQTTGRFFVSFSNDGSGHVYRGDSLSGFLTPPSDLTLSNSKISESAAVGTTVGAFTTTDANNAVTFAYGLGTSADDQAFNVVGGNLVTNTTLNSTVQSTYDIDVTVTDSDGLSYVKYLTITVQSAPTAINLPTPVVKEGMAVGTVIGTLSTSEGGVGHNYIYTFAAGGTDNSSFTIDGNTLRTNAVFNAAIQSSYSILIQVQDGNGGTFVQSLVITVQPLPSAITLSSTQVNEGMAAGTTIGTLSTTEALPPHADVYSLVPGAADNANFTITGNSLMTTAVFNAATKSSYSIVVQVQDENFNIFQQTLTINVLPIPTAIFLSKSTMNDGMASGSTVGTLSTTENLNGHVYTYTLANGGPDNASFTICNNVLKTTTAIDIAAKTNYVILVQVQDENDNSFLQAFFITVVPVPTAISLTNSTVTEGQAAGTFIGMLSTTEKLSGHTDTYTLVPGVADNSSFQLVGFWLETATVLNAGTKSSYSILVQVQDENGNIFQQSFTITVQPVPTAITLSNNNVYEGLAVGTPLGTFSTTESLSGHTFTYTIPPVYLDNSFFTICGNQLKTAAVFNANDRPVYVIQVQVQDENGHTFQQQIAIFVQAAPTAISLNNSNLVDGTVSGMPVGQFSTQESFSGHTFTYSLVAGAADNASFTIIGNNLVTTTTINMSTKPVYSVLVKVVDEHGNAFQQTLSINVVNPTVNGFSVNGGAITRSYVDSLDVSFTTSMGLNALLATGRVTLTHYDLNGTLLLTQNIAQWNGAVVTVVGNTLHVQFSISAGGLGGTSLTGDGYYQLRLLNSSGAVYASKTFDRLQGDFNGLGHFLTTDVSTYNVSKTVYSAAYDVTGQGQVAGAATAGYTKNNWITFSTLTTGRKLNGSMILDA